MGKHPKKITCGAWSMSNTLAMGSEDKCLTISDSEGETSQQVRGAAEVKGWREGLEGCWSGVVGS